MLIIRPTTSLAKRMNEKLAPSEETSSTKLGDWFANDIILGRKQFIMCMSSKSKLTIVMEAAPYSRFPDRLGPYLVALLREFGVGETIIREETDEMDDFSLAKTNDRSVLSVMNQFQQDLKVLYDLGRLDVSDTTAMSLLMSRNITLTLDELHPSEAAFGLLGFAPQENLAQVIPFRKP